MTRVWHKPLFRKEILENDNYRVVVHTVLGRFEKYFDSHKKAKAFYQKLREGGSMILANGTVITKSGIREIVLEGREGVTIRPAPAIMLPDAKTG